MKKLRRLCFIAFFLSFSINLFAQSESEEIRKVKKRAEEMLQVIRAEKWDETYKFVVVVTDQRDKVTRQRMEISQQADRDEIKKKVGEWFMNLYTAPKPGSVLEARLKENDRTVAQIAYHHEDIDGFYMVLIDGEWYYTLEY